MGRRTLSDLGNLVLLEGRLLGEGPEGPDILKQWWNLMSLQWKILDGNCKIEIWVFEQIYEFFGWKEAVDG